MSESSRDTSRIFNALEAERKCLGRRMGEIGGSGSERHGEFHTLRKRWVEVVEKMGRVVWKRDPTPHIVGKGFDYGPGGEQEMCPYEECSCEENPNRVRNPTT